MELYDGISFYWKMHFCDSTMLYLSMTSHVVIYQFNAYLLVAPGPVSGSCYWHNSRNTSQALLTIVTRNGFIACTVIALARRRHFDCLSCHFGWGWVWKRSTIHSECTQVWHENVAAPALTSTYSALFAEFIHDRVRWNPQREALSKTSSALH